MLANTSSACRLPFKRILVNHALRLNHTLRSGPVLLPNRGASLPHHAHRHATFSTTARCLATEDPYGRVVAETQLKLTRLLLERPELLQIVRDMQRVMEEEGVDLGSKILSPTEVLEVLNKPRVRDAVIKAGEALEEAGVDPKVGAAIGGYAERHGSEGVNILSNPRDPARIPRLVLNCVSSMLTFSCTHIAFRGPGWHTSTACYSESLALALMRRLRVDA
ncbi:hypothetical protein WOLCODRAFT_137495 [Wolfiporia cocos MD-104 SS10]|uniref:Uncharacterized protein n=1 Tax=Wolfiporia cocos (strain MD-104) TaxID=742152 RepID=A0A2H3JS43_WOLCO|nr:hypothetical protein WOLCODRAFT_137495 [Wolfiporia cocos MD-104 SS10]